ncbi:MAG: inorganic diphosphatase [Herpetosiphon sp.]
MAVNYWHDLEPGPEMPEVVNVIVEIPHGSRNKYEYDKDAGTIKLDRVLFSPVYYPGDYGFIPQTFYDDGDPLDVLVITNAPTFPGCLVEARPVGIFHLIDKGEPDDKILAVLQYDPYFSNIKDYTELSPHFLRQVTHFFSVYKELEGHTTEARGWDGVKEAHAAIRRSHDLYWDMRAGRLKSKKG